MIREGMAAFLVGRGVVNPTPAMIDEALAADTAGTLDQLIPELVNDAQVLADPTVRAFLSAVIYVFDQDAPRGEPRPGQLAVRERAIAREFKAAIAAMDGFRTELAVNDLA